MRRVDDLVEALAVVDEPWALFFRHSNIFLRNPASSTRQALARVLLSRFEKRKAVATNSDER